MPVVARLAIVHDPIAAMWQHAVRAAGVRRGIAICRARIAFLSALHASIAAQGRRLTTRRIEMAIRIASQGPRKMDDITTFMAVQVVPIAVFAVLHDPIAADSSPGLSRLEQNRKKYTPNQYSHVILPSQSNP